MTPFYREHGRWDRFLVTLLRGDTGAWIEYNFLEDHAQEIHPNIIVFVAGRFLRYRVDDPKEFLEFVPGDTNDKIGPRKKGRYRLEAKTDGTLHICVSALGTLFRPKHERIEVKTYRVLQKGELAVIVTGKDAGDIIAAVTQDASISGPCSYERFWYERP